MSTFLSIWAIIGLALGLASVFFGEPKGEPDPLDSPITFFLYLALVVVIWPFIVLTVALGVKR